MHNSTFSHYFPSSPTARCWKLYDNFAAVFFLSGVAGTDAPHWLHQLYPNNHSAGWSKRYRLNGQQSGYLPSGNRNLYGTVNLNGNNSALCVGPNVRFAQNANLNFRGNNVVITNFGTRRDHLT